MKLKYYGTAAAEGWPGLFCRCDHCARARSAGGRNIRTRSQAAVDGKLLIDLPSDTYHHVLTGGLDLASFADLLVTHAHFDHFAPDELWCRHEGIAHRLPEDAPTLTVWGSEAVTGAAAGFADGKRVVCRTLAEGVTVNIGGRDVTPMTADHDQNAGARIHHISDGKTSLLYAHDTGWFPDSTWKRLAELTAERPLGLASLDCTNVNLAGYRGHMGVDACRRVKEKLLAEGMADENTVFVLNHFSHNGGAIYDELAAAVGDEFTVSYDGLEIEF